MLFYFYAASWWCLDSKLIHLQLLLGISTPPLQGYLKQLISIITVTSLLNSSE
jgi:hypothetical protein